tara:strand:+ start:111 stop:1976 length:1866 start_codon:yes stop_codon:yes gene_type:complete
MRNIFFIILLCFLSNNLGAETISTATTQTSTKTISEDLTITSTGSINCIETAESGWANCIKIQDNSTPLTITNRGSLYTTSNDNDKDTIIRARDSEESDLTIKNYGTMESIGNSTLYLTNLSDGDGDGISAYVYNEGTINATRAYTVRFDGSDDFKIDNYGTITNTNASGQTLYYRDDSELSGFILNNYAGGIISAPNSGGCSNDATHLGAINAQENVTGSTINNWGTITAKCDTMRIGASGTLNNYGTIKATGDPSYLSIETNGDNNTLNFYDGTLIVGTIDADDDSGNTLNFNLCSSYSYYLTGSWSVNDKSGCGDVVYSGGYAKSSSAISQSMADEIAAQRVDHINEAFDYSNKNINKNKEFGFFSKSYSNRDNGDAIDKFASFQNNVAIGFPLNNPQYNGHQIFSFSSDTSDFLNLNVSSSSFQSGFVLEDLNFFTDKKIGLKSVFGYHKHKSNRTQLNNTVASGKETINKDYDSFSAIIGSQIQNGNIKINLDTSFQRFPNYIESEDVTWNSRLIGQFMGDITYDLKRNLNKKFSFTPEIGLGYRTLFLGKSQKYRIAGQELTFRNGTQEDFFGKLGLNANYSFSDNTNLFIKTLAKKTTEDQETYGLNFAFISVF